MSVQMQSNVSMTGKQHECQVIWTEQAVSRTPKHREANSLT